VIRYAGMPLERLAMVLNSSQVSGSGQFSQAANIVFKDGKLAPYRTVGRASIVAWFLQYSVMGCVFQVRVNPFTLTLLRVVVCGLVLVVCLCG